MDQVLRNTAATVTVTFYNGSSPVDADADPTVVVKRADGTTLLSTTATNEPDPGVYSVIIPAQSSLNILTLVWTGEFDGTEVSIESIVEIVGGFYFSIAELRNYDSALANTTKYPNTALIEARNLVESEFEDICERAFVPRFHREVTETNSGYYTLDSWSEGYIELEKPEPIRVNALKVNNVDRLTWYSDGNIYKAKEDPHQLVFRSVAGQGIRGATKLELEYEYGMTQVPTPIKQKALKRAKMVLLGMNSTIDERASTMSLPDIGIINLVTPGQRGSETGIPDIDVVLDRYKLSGGASGAVAL